MHRIFACVVSLLLYGCGTITDSMLNHLNSPITAEEREVLVERAKLTKDHTVEPVYSLIRGSCKYHMSNGSWPKLRKKEASSGSFEYLKIIESNAENFEMEFKLTTVNAPTKVVIKSIKEDAPYQFHLDSQFETGNFNVSSNFSCDGNGLNDDELLTISTKVTSVLDSYNAMEKLKMSESNQLSSNQLVDMGAQVIICMLLKLEPNQCN